MKFSKVLILCAVFLLASAMAIAAEIQPAEKAVQDKIKNSLSILLPGISPDSINQTPLNGIYEVVFGPRLVYMTADGKYLLQGNIVDLETRANLTEPRLQQLKAIAMEKVGTDNMIIFSPPAGTPVKHRVNIFTDIDCGYCRKLHREMSDYNNAGIEIRYLFYPRAGKGSESYVKAIQVWCSDDRHEAMNTAKAGKSLQSKTDCANPVDRHMELGGLLGVTGTPAMVLSDGKMLPGYVPADRLIKVLDAYELEKN